VAQLRSEQICEYRAAPLHVVAMIEDSISRVCVCVCVSVASARSSSPSRPID